MNIFKSGKLDLHPAEKLLMLISTILVDFAIFLVGYTLIVGIEGFNFTGGNKGDNFNHGSRGTYGFSLV